MGPVGENDYGVHLRASEYVQVLFKKYISTRRLVYVLHSVLH